MQTQMYLNKLNTLANLGFRLTEPAFKVFTAYENVAASAQARNIRLQLDNPGDDEIEISGVSWCFALLRSKNLQQNAAQEAADADMIIISVHGTRLPEHVTSWIDAWPARLKTTPAALVIMLDTSKAGSPEQKTLVDYFREVAERHGRDFFCNVEECEDADDTLSEDFEAVNRLDGTRRSALWQPRRVNSF